MFKCFLAFAGVLAGILSAPLSAQNFSIAYQTPDQLVVCSTDTLGMVIQNNTAAPVSGASFELELPPGLEYLPGSASGAAESDIANLEKPIFALPNLAPGASLPVRVQLLATCGLVDAINSAQLFSALLRVRAGAAVEQVTTTKFQIQTSLLVVTQVDNNVFTGEKGDMFVRTLHVRNTRLGPVRHLFLKDDHGGGLSIHVDGTAWELDGLGQYTAYFDGAFFSQFGNGDTLLDFNETLLIRQEVTITHCGMPPPQSRRSKIEASWSCTAVAAPCQTDSVLADVHIKPSTYLPIVSITGTYPIPWDVCAEVPAPAILQVVNYGTAPATNVYVNLQIAVVTGNTAIDQNSLRLVVNGVTTPITPNLFNPLQLALCGADYAGGVEFYIPEVLANDTVLVLYDFYYCTNACAPESPQLDINYFYQVPCPEGGSESSVNQIIIRPTDLLLAAVHYQIAECLDDGETYNLKYVLNSDRLQGDSGYLWLQLDLPWGLFWSPDCPPVLAGKTPFSFSIDTLLPIQRVVMGFELPFPASAQTLNFCLRSTCSEQSQFVPAGASDAPNSDGIFYVYETPPGEYCGPCGYKVHAKAMLSESADVSNLGCAYSVCDNFVLRTSCDDPEKICGDNNTNGSGGGGGLGWSEDVVARQHFYAERVNLGFPDNDDNRDADASGALDLEKIRRDRFIAGDTLLATFGTKILQGDSISALQYELFVETVRSDFGYANVFDTIELGPLLLNTARQHLANNDSFQLVGMNLMIWDSSSNTQYSCPTVFNAPYYDKLYGYVLPVNIKPVAAIDQLTSMSHYFRPQFSTLAASGCLPAGFLLSAGDSVALETVWKMAFNFRPFSKQNRPPLINVELGFLANPDNLHFYNYRQHDTLMIQYSGVWDSLTAGTFGIRPCEPSQQVTPFAYNIRLARENLFPYEVRPLSVISDYALLMPPGIVPNAAQLLFLNLQENTPLLQNLSLPFSTIPDTALYVDFSPAYTKPIDEGYSLRTQFVFDPSCAFTAPDSSIQYVTLDFTGCIAMPNPQVEMLKRILGFYSNHPKDTMTTAEPVYYFPTGAVFADFLLRNLAPANAPNYWIAFENPEGGLTNPTLTILGPGTVLTPTNGIFQLGNLPQLAQRDLRISATNTSCDPQHLIVRYGWDCQPHLLPGTPSCGQDTIVVLFEPRNPEIELELVNLPANLPLCDTSDFIVLEISNADLGHAYQPFINIELPAGLQLQPGSCGMAYPAGSAFVPIPDPTDVGNNLLEWNLAALQSAVADDGLPGVNTSPQNALRIRFRVVAECGAVSNAQLILGARAEWYCGNPTNSLRKASDPIIVEGAMPTYSVQVNVNEPIGGPVPCHTERNLSVSLVLSGPALPGDSVYVYLPSGFVYVPGSYVPGANALPAGPQIAGDVIRWALPAALPANSVVQFSFRVLSGSVPNCSGALVRVQTRQRSAAFCASINDFCTVYVATGEALLPFLPFVPDLAITAATGSINAAGMGLYTVQVVNNGALPGTLSEIQIVRDVDGNGILSAADTVFFSHFPAKTLAAGEAFAAQIQSGNPLDLCQLLVVIPADENCACSTVSFPLSAQEVTYTPANLCVGQTALVGLPGSPANGHTYTWSGAGAPPCTDCPQFNFQPPGPGAFALTLTDAGPGCTVKHLFQIMVNEPPVLLTTPAPICRGETVLLQTSAAVTWNWQGPGITNAGAATQSVQPSQNVTYFVTATNAAGCTLTASLTVTVFATDSLDLGTLRTCSGTPVDVFGTLQDTPGFYSQLLTNANGCDSLVFLQLEVVPHTEENISRCPPDPVLVFGEAVTQAGTYCQTFTSSLGCDSMHCVVVSDFSIPSLPDPDTIYFVSGTSVVLPGPGGYASYLWMPAEGLSCTTCPSPTATPPMDTMEYALVVRTGDDCPDTVVYRLLAFPPCDPARIRVPNAFTPDGDGVNDTFAPVPYEGVEVIARLTIYNRWGQKIYDSTGPNAAWDGKTFGEPAPSDVYVWLLEVVCAGEERKFRKGDVTVLR